jgi:hypothetical protein
MTAIPASHRTTQMVLFSEQSIKPSWSDLAESTRIEVISLLAQLLVSVQAANRVSQEQGGRDE